MTRYGYKLTFPDGEEMFNDPDLGDGPYDSYEEAEAAAYECISLCRQGAEVLHMSNPGEYEEMDDADEPDIEIIEQD